MSETLKTLSNIRSLRVLARETSLEQLEALLEKLTIVIEEKREDVKAKELEQAKFLESLNKYKVNNSISCFLSCFFNIFLCPFIFRIVD